MNRCVLHIGQSKTGTSAIQGFLYLNKTKIQNQGMLYPGVNFHGVNINLVNHNSLADSLTCLERYPEIKVEEYFRQFSEQLIKNNCHTLLISGEHFFGGEPRAWDVQSKKEYITLYKKKLKTLHLYLKKYELTIIIYLRSQAEWLESAISQVIRYEGLIGKKIYQDDYQFFELMKPVLDYDSLLSQWVNILNPKELICIPYHRDCLFGGNSVSDFIKRLGLVDEELNKNAMDYSEHDSLAREYIELKKILNKDVCSKSEEWVRIHCLNRANDKNNSGKKYHVSEDLYRKIQEFYSTINVNITNKYIKKGKFGISIMEDRLNTVSDSEIAKATEVYNKEYSSLSAKLKRIEVDVKIYMRTNFKILHAYLYKLKTIIKVILYKLS